MMSDGNSIIEPCASNSYIHDHATHPIRIFPAADHYHDHQFLQTMISANHPELPWLQTRSPTSCNDHDLHSFLLSSSSCIKSRVPASSSPNPSAASSSNHPSDLDHPPSHEPSFSPKPSAAAAPSSHPSDLAHPPSHEKTLQSLIVSNEDASCCRLITSCIETLPDYYCESERLRYLSALINEGDAGHPAGSFRNTGYDIFECADRQVLSMASDYWLDETPLMRTQPLMIHEGNDPSDSNPSPAVQSLMMHNADDRQSDGAPSSPAQLCIHNADDLMYPHETDSLIINADDEFLQLQLLQSYINNNNSTADHLMIDEGASAAPVNYHGSSDLEEVLDILLEKVECSASAHSASPSISPSIITSNYGLSINDATINHKRSSEVALVSPHSSKKNMNDSSDVELLLRQQNQAEARASWQEKDQGENVRASWQQYTQAGEEVRASWQQDEAGEIRPSWQQQQQKEGEIRASWQQTQPGEVRAGWQQKQDGEARANWQQKSGEARTSLQEKEEGEIRASWQQKQGSKSERGEGAPTTQQQQVDDRSKDYDYSLNALMQSYSKYGYMSNTNGPSTRNKAGTATLTAWAGPTLLDIQKALNARPINHTAPTSANTSTDDSSSASLTLQQEEAQTAQDKTMSSFLTDEVALLCKDDLEQAHKLNDSWRARLQKRGNIGPKYTVRVRSEEEAARDGYRWRKYGQKSIKNSPFPRCYYKCTSGNCLVKKQVERCIKDSRIFVVTYEGLHVHTRPDVCHLCASSSNFPHSQCH